MDPVSIITTIVTITNILAELNRIRDLYSNAGGILALIQQDCDQIHTVLHHFKDLLAQRHTLAPASDDEVNLIRLEELLVSNCLQLEKDVERLRGQLQKISMPDNRGELLMNRMKLLVKLRPLQQSHDAIRQRLKDFRHQKSSWDR